MLFLVAVLLAGLCSAAVPSSDACRVYSSSCELCASLQGCFWCAFRNASASSVTAVCVENFPSIRSDCELLVLTAAFCSTQGLAFVASSSDGAWKASAGTIAAMVTRQNPSDASF